MRILIVSSSYPPEIRSSSHLMQELAEELRDRGHRVAVATCYPRHNMAESPRQDIADETDEAGIRVIRIHTPPPHKGSFIVRGFSQIALPYIFQSKLGKSLSDPIDAVIVYSPPLSLWQVGHFVKKKFGARFILNIQDIFPQNAIDLGILDNAMVIHYFECMEKRAYDHADVVTVHSPSNGDFLLGRGKVLASKLATLHNWVDVDAYQGVPGSESYRKRLNLETSFIFFFGGVLGPSQGLDLIIQAAREIRHEKNIAFLLAGDGIEKDRLMMRVRQENLNNVIFHPFISKAEYGKLLNEMDVGLVCLSAKNKTPVVPGKILGYMSAGIPIIAFLNRESDGHQIIREACCGYSEFADTNRPSQLILKMIEEKNRLKEMGLNGRQYAVSHFSRRICIDRLEDLLSGKKIA